MFVSHTAYRVRSQVRCPRKDSFSYTAIDGIFIVASAHPHQTWGMANSLHRYQARQLDSAIANTYRIPELWQGPAERSNENTAHTVAPVEMTPLPKGPKVSLSSTSGSIRNEKPMVLAPIVRPDANNPPPVPGNLLASVLSHSLIADFIPVSEEKFQEGNTRWKNRFFYNVI